MMLQLLLLVLLSAPAYATDLWLYGGIGGAQSSVNDKPNLWKQTDYPYQFSGTDLGWRTGIGTSWNNGLFVEVGAVSIGSPSIHSRFVPDDHLRPGTGECYKKCGQEYQRDLHLDNSYLGGEAVVGYQHKVLDLFVPYVKAGIAGFAHQHSGSVQRHGHRAWHFDGNNQPTTERLEGMMLAAVIGGGLCGDVYKGIMACGDVEKFLPFAHTANPLIDTGFGGPVLTTFQVRFPITWTSGTTRDYLWQR